MKCFVIIILIASAMNTAHAQDKKNQPVLNHQAIFVTDLKKAADFYRNIIGLQQIEEPFKVGKHAWFQTGPKTSLHIILGADAKKEYFKNHHMCFSVPSIETFIEKLNAAGVGFEDAAGKKGGITNRVDGVKQIWLQDPEGYWIEINNDPASF